MLKEVHEHVVNELEQNAKTDTVFVVAAVLFNLIVLGINWGVADSARRQEQAGANDWILLLLFVATLLINFFAVKALLAGKVTRGKLLSGLIEMYKDNDVQKYYDPSLLDSYSTRYKLFVAVLLSLALISILVPLLVRLVGV